MLIVFDGSYEQSSLGYYNLIPNDKNKWVTVTGSIRTRGTKTTFGFHTEATYDGYFANISIKATEGPSPSKIILSQLNFGWHTIYNVNYQNVRQIRINSNAAVGKYGARCYLSSIKMNNIKLLDIETNPIGDLIGDYVPEKYKTLSYIINDDISYVTKYDKGDQWAGPTLKRVNNNKLVKWSSGLNENQQNRKSNIIIYQPSADYKTITFKNMYSADSERKSRDITYNIKYEPKNAINSNKENNSKYNIIPATSLVKTKIIDETHLLRPIKSSANTEQYIDFLKDEYARGRLPILKKYKFTHGEITYYLESNHDSSEILLSSSDSNDSKKFILNQNKWPMDYTNNESSLQISNTFKLPDTINDISSLEYKNTQLTTISEDNYHRCLGDLSISNNTQLSELGGISSILYVGDQSNPTVSILNATIIDTVPSNTVGYNNNSLNNALDGNIYTTVMLRNQGGESFSRETFAMSIQLTDLLDITQLSLYYKNETDTSTNYYKLHMLDANNVKIGNELILNASELKWHNFENIDYKQVKKLRIFSKYEDEVNGETFNTTWDDSNPLTYLGNFNSSTIHINDSGSMATYNFPDRIGYFVWDSSSKTYIDSDNSDRKMTFSLVDGSIKLIYKVSNQTQNTATLSLSNNNLSKFTVIDGKLTDRNSYENQLYTVTWEDGKSDSSSITIYADGTQLDFGHRSYKWNESSQKYLYNTHAITLLSSDSGGEISFTLKDNYATYTGRFVHRESVSHSYTTKIIVESQKAKHPNYIVKSQSTLGPSLSINAVKINGLIINNSLDLSILSPSNITDNLQTRNVPILSEDNYLTIREQKSLTQYKNELDESSSVFAEVYGKSSIQSEIGNWSVHNGKLSEVATFEGKTNVLKLEDDGEYTAIYQTIDTKPGRLYYISYLIYMDEYYYTNQWVNGMFLAIDGEFNNTIGYLRFYPQLQPSDGNNVQSASSTTTTDPWGNYKKKWLKVEGFVRSLSNKTTFAIHTEGKLSAHIANITMTDTNTVYMEDGMFKNIPKQQIYTLAWNDNFIQEMIILTTGELLIQDPVNKRWGIYKYDSNNKQYYYNDDSFYYIKFYQDYYGDIIIKDRYYTGRLFKGVGSIYNNRYMALSYDRDFLVRFKDNNEEVTITVDTHGNVTYPFGDDQTKYIDEQGKLNTNTIGKWSVTYSDKGFRGFPAHSLTIKETGEIVINSVTYEWSTAPLLIGNDSRVGYKNITGDNASYIFFKIENDKLTMWDHPAYSGELYRTITPQVGFIPNNLDLSISFFTSINNNQRIAQVLPPNKPHNITLSNNKIINPTTQETFYIVNWNDGYKSAIRVNTDSTISVTDSVDSWRDFTFDPNTNSYLFTSSGTQDTTVPGLKIVGQLDNGDFAVIYGDKSGMMSIYKKPSSDIVTEINNLEKVKIINGQISNISDGNIVYKAVANNSGIIYDVIVQPNNTLGDSDLILKTNTETVGMIFNRNSGVYENTNKNPARTFKVSESDGNLSFTLDYSNHGNLFLFSSYPKSSNLEITGNNVITNVTLPNILDITGDLIIKDNNNVSEVNLPMLRNIKGNRIEILGEKLKLIDLTQLSIDKENMFIKEISIQKGATIIVGDEVFARELKALNNTEKIGILNAFLTLISHIALIIVS